MQLGTQENKHGSQLLSFPFDDVFHHPIEQRGFTAYRIGKLFFKSVQFRSDAVFYKVHVNRGQFTALNPCCKEIYRVTGCFWKKSIELKQQLLSKSTP
jgi:hypothetical protein